MDDLGNAIAAPTPEEKLAWESELAKVEEEIRTLRQVRENYLMTFLRECVSKLLPSSERIFGT